MTMLLPYNKTLLVTLKWPQDAHLGNVSPAYFQLQQEVQFEKIGVVLQSPFSIFDQAFLNVRNK